MPVPEFHMLLSLPSKLKHLILPFKAFMLASRCFCLSVIASSCLLKAAFVVFFHPQLHLFHITLGTREAGAACLQCHRAPGGKGWLQDEGAMQKKPATWSVSGSDPIGKGTRSPPFVLCRIMVCAGLLKLRVLDIMYKGCGLLNHKV